MHDVRHAVVYPHVAKEVFWLSREVALVTRLLFMLQMEILSWTSKARYLHTGVVSSR
jgi:hypothetical protein